MPGIANRHANLNRLARQNEDFAEVGFSRAFAIGSVDDLGSRIPPTFVVTTDKFTTAFPGPDGVGDVKPEPPTYPFLVNTTDEAGNGIGVAPGNPVVTVGAPSTLGTIQTPGDQDYYQVTLVAGQVYEIGMYQYAGSVPPTPLTDPYIELYDAAGILITEADGGANTPANEVNSGFDVLLTYTAEVSGTYYINARGFGNATGEEGGGDEIGDYELFVREQDPNDPNLYTPYYDLDSPLYSLDWGSMINKVHQSARNPDGNEGTRNTGNAQGTPEIYDGPNQAQTTGNPGGFPNAPAMYDDPLVDSVTDADANPVGDPTPLTFTVPGKNVITVYYAREGEEYKFDDPSQPGLTEILPAQGFQPFEIDAMRNALASYADVADIQYIEVEQAYVAADPINPSLGMRAHADLTILLYAGTFRTGLLGRHSPPDEGNEGQGEYNNLGPGWEAGKLVPGGFSFVTLIHELGHAHGMSHPFDGGGRSAPMRGVEQEVDENGVPVPFSYTLGEHNLNQAIYTVMSYQDGWPLSPYGNAPTNAGYGYQTGLSAFDIAVMQDKYGVNEEVRAGNNVYVLPEANAVAILNPDGTVQTRATGYTTIWDGDGIDEIQYLGSRNATIDLRQATLLYEEGGGGWMSYTTGATAVYAGFTIANGVTIENARSGSGNDVLTGNSAANLLDGGSGIDAMTGLGGDDSYFVDHAGDIVVEATGGGYDIVYAAAGYILSAGTSVEVLATVNNFATTAINLTGNELDNYVTGNAGANTLDGGSGGADQLWGREGDDSYFVDVGDAVVEYAGHGYDIVYARASYAVGVGMEVDVLGTVDNFATTAINLTGNEGDNYIVGNAGSNTLDGGAGGFDQLWGREGNDSYLADANDIVVEYAGHGHDILYARTSLVLRAGLDIEVLGTVDNFATTAINLTGNELANYVTGNAGANRIDGGAGADYLEGRGGADVFAFTTALGAGNVDTIADFLAGTDKIGLDDALFAGIGGPGSLNANAFVTGTAAQDANDRIIYNQALGQLFYDADGNGAGAQILFATTGGISLSASDFTVI